MQKFSAVRLFHLMPPELAHDAAIALLRLMPGVKTLPTQDSLLASRLWGLDFSNPIGLAAGFDKNAQVAAKMFAFGFGFVEVGTITPNPQKGNPTPRLFRLADDFAVINRMGFNGKGLDYARARLAALRPHLPYGAVLGVNIGMNRDSADPLGDIALGIKNLTEFADYLVINISSPNTPGLRGWEEGDALVSLVDTAHRTRAEKPGQEKKPLLFKIAPDLNSDQLTYIAALALEKKLDGVMIGNTTVTRPPELESPYRHEQGGLSGRPLFRPSTKILRQFYRLTDGKIPLIGIGGISTGYDAYVKIKAGASLTQLYTGMVYHGPGIAARINAELAQLLQADGYKTLSEAVGVEKDTKFDDNIF